MDSDTRLTRRAFVRRGVTSAVAFGVALDATSKASAAVPDGDLVVGRFVSAQGARSGVVSVAGGRLIPVTLDSAAFVAHGADGIVDSLTAFVAGEEVVVRGATSERGIAAIEFQSVYTCVTGTVTPDGAAYLLVTPSRERVRVPQRVVQLHVPSGIQSGATYTATIWTDPDTDEATAVELSAGS